MRRLTWMAAPLLLIALVLGACSSDGNSGTPSPDASTGQSTPTEAPSGGGSGGGDADLDALADLAARFERARFSATYLVDSPDMPSGEWVWTQDPDGERTRFDMSQDGETLTMIITAAATYMCSDGSCLSMTAEMGGGLDELPDLGSQLDDLQDELGSGTVRSTGSREIAGTRTECYEFEDADEGITGTVCHTEEGVPLFLSSVTPEGEFTLEATAYSTSVSDADFEPPFPVVSLEDALGGLTIPTPPR